MIIGIPTEVKVMEKRVAVTPSGVRTLVQGKHEVLLQSGAGQFRLQNYPCPCRLQIYHASLSPANDVM